MPRTWPMVRAVTLAVCWFGLAMPAASAHAILIESTPSTNVSVPAGPLTIRLRFNSRVDPGRSRLSLAHLPGDESVLPQGVSPRPDVLVAGAAVIPGSYVLRWQVLAVDGHITRGAVPFNVVPGANAAKADAQ